MMWTQMMAAGFWVLWPCFGLEKLRTSDKLGPRDRDKKWKEWEDEVDKGVRLVGRLGEGAYEGACKGGRGALGGGAGLGQGTREGACERGKGAFKEGEGRARYERPQHTKARAQSALPSRAHTLYLILYSMCIQRVKRTAIWSTYCIP